MVVLHRYDILMMAPAAVPHMLRDMPSMKGIFTMRSRKDADNFKNHIDPAKGKVVIVGGGLLGIELAASLREVNVEVTIVQAISQINGSATGSIGQPVIT